MSNAHNIRTPDPHAPRTVRLAVVSRRERKRYVLLGTLGAVWSATLSSGFGQALNGGANPAPPSAPLSVFANSGPGAPAQSQQRARGENA
ncbi:MAG: hypothetical protein ABF491_05065, partial [Acetobacter sp.]|uniref:hypothetical protein n=1 Tax=Acetobacter sp. TaxID=440 RepID=UPI0039ECEE32